MRFDKLLLLCILLSGCGYADKPQRATSVQSDAIGNALKEHPLDTTKLKKSTRDEFDMMFPNSARNVLAEVDLLEISVRDRKVNLGKGNERTRLLNSIYRDVIDSIQDERKLPQVGCVDPFTVL